MSQRRQPTPSHSQFSTQAIKESAARQVGEVVTTSQDALTSGAWIYPIQVRGGEGDPSWDTHSDTLLLIMQCNTRSQGIFYLLSRALISLREPG
jgi:hypothetical protein